MNAGKVTQALFAIQLSLFGAVVAIAGRREFGVFPGRIGSVVGLVAVAGQEEA